MKKTTYTITDQELIKSYFSCDPDWLEWLEKEEDVKLILYVDQEEETALYEVNNGSANDGRIHEDNYEGVQEWIEKEEMEED